jgi:hypothetical protein
VHRLRKRRSLRQTEGSGPEEEILLLRYG